MLNVCSHHKRELCVTPVLLLMVSCRQHQESSARESIYADESLNQLLWVLNFDALHPDFWADACHTVVLARNQERPSNHDGLQICKASRMSSSAMCIAKRCRHQGRRFLSP